MSEFVQEFIVHRTDDHFTICVSTLFIRFPDCIKSFLNKTH